MRRLTLLLCVLCCWGVVACNSNTRSLNVEPAPNIQGETVIHQPESSALDPFEDTPNSEGELPLFPYPELETLVTGILELPIPKIPPTATPKGEDGQWKYLDRVKERFVLNETELAMLKEKGVVVLPKAEYQNYALGLNEVYTSQLPLYVSADAIFNTVYASHKNILIDIELQVLKPELEKVLRAMYEALPKASADYPTDVSSDLDLYLNVALALLTEAEVPTHFGNEKKSNAWVSKANAAKEFDWNVHLFGRQRTVDFTAYTPRSHYADVEELSPYFKASMWLSRIAFNLSSRSCRNAHPEEIECDTSETPREAAVALALSDLAERSGAMERLANIERAWSVLAGKREDISLAELAQLRREAGITKITVEEAGPKLVAAIGDMFQRTTRFHYAPEEEDPKNLAAISTVLGPRIVADTTALMPVLNPNLQGRFLVQAMDPIYMLGHDHALKHLAEDRARWQGLDDALKKGRTLLEANLEGDNLYSHWLQAIQALSSDDEGLKPSFMKTDAYRDLRINSTVAAFGQLRHNNVLFAAEMYDSGGCEIPDGYVEPAVEVYKRLGDYARYGALFIEDLNPEEGEYIRHHFQLTEKIMGVLEHISRRQLAGAPLSKEELGFLNMVTESGPGYGEGPEYNGWYFQLMYSSYHNVEESEIFRSSDFVASLQTSVYKGKIVYAGTRQPRMGLFVIDSNGPPRVMVGPVARSYQHTGPLKRRLDNTSARNISDIQEPWAASYTAPAVKTPPLAFQDLLQGSFNEENEAIFKVRSSKRLPKVTLTLLNHHREPLVSQVVKVGRKAVTVKMPQTAPRAKPGKDLEQYDFAEVLQVQVGDYIGWFGGYEEDPFWRTRGIGGMKPQEEEYYD